jgi:hypothetical protein
MKLSGLRVSVLVMIAGKDWLPDDLIPLTIAQDISTTMKHYVRAKEEAERRAFEGVSLGRIIGEGA